MSPAQNYVFLTPSYARDLLRVRLLCDSLREAGDDTPHHVIVHTEDFELFQREFAGHAAVHIGKTLDYLGAVIDHGRYCNVHRIRGWRLLNSIQKRMMVKSRARTLAIARGMNGWYHQQITKLIAASRLPAAAIVVLDSDLVCVRKTCEADFFDNTGKPYLIEVAHETLAHVHYARWLEATLDFFQLTGESRQRFRHHNYVFGPTVWSSQLVRELLAYIEGERKTTLLDLFASKQIESEFYLYGIFTRTRHPDAIAVRSAPLSDEVCEPRPAPLIDVVRSVYRPQSQPFLWLHGFLPYTPDEIRQAVARVREESPLPM